MQTLMNLPKKWKGKWPLIFPFVASLFLAKWTDPHFMESVSKVGTTFGKQQVVNSIPDLIYLGSVVAGAFGSVFFCLLLLSVGMGWIAGKESVLTRVSLDYYFLGYLIAAFGYLILGFLELKTFIVRFDQLLIDHFVVRKFTQTFVSQAKILGACGSV